MLIVDYAKRLIPGRLKRRVTFRRRYRVGRGTYGIPIVHHRNKLATIRVGSFCSIADGVTIFLGGEHHVDWITTYPFTLLRNSAKGIPGDLGTKGDVVIGNDVWIGEGATILSGVTIGDGAVIGAHAVIAKNVPAYTIVVGNPAIFVKKRFTDEEIEILENIAWWEWSDDKIDSAMPLLLSSAISELRDFAARYSGVE